MIAFKLYIDENLLFLIEMALPMADCSSYKVGNCAENMKEHSLPQLRAFKQKRKQLMVSNLRCFYVVVLVHLECTSLTQSTLDTSL
jgi:hypothetical protein